MLDFGRRKSTYNSVYLEINSLAIACEMKAAAIYLQRLLY